MLLEPEWIEDMVTVLSDMTIEMQKILFEQEGYPDGIWYYEDMGFKGKPFMAPELYQELIMPAHTKTIAYAHSVGLPVIMHSCGFVEPLLPYMIEAGIDCLQVIEIKAGMDLLRIHKQFGDKIALMGGIDVRKLYTNDFDIITEELESKIPIVKNGFGFVAHSDHSIPKTVDYETFKFYIDKVIELGTY
jgi:uroporphyrinogen decarboxylase